MSRRQILGQNGKMIKTSEQHPGSTFVNFTLPPSPCTCPNAGACARGCYGMAGRMAMPRTRKAYTENLEMVLDGTLWVRLDAEITLDKVIASQQGRELRVRIHDAGDFFSEEYAMRWIETARVHPDVIFYAYTKMVSLMKSLPIPPNLRIIYSYGGTEDDLIGPDDPHAIVIPRDGEVPPGYTDGSHDDWYASEGCHRIALRYHGPKTLSFTAGPEVI